MMNLMTGLHKS